METTRTDDVRKAVHTAREQVRTSLLAALGAGNLAGEAVADAVSKARERVTESSESARRNIEELPGELEQLRDRLDPAELRRLLDEYTDSALRLYRRLAESGEQTWDRLSEQPQVRQAVEQLEEALHSAQERMDDVTSDTRERVDEMVSRVSRRTRETGHRAGTAVEEAGERAADALDEAAEPVRSGRPDGSGEGEEPHRSGFDRAADGWTESEVTDLGTRGSS
ncbi:hypothetical protein [Saccharomonospora iraqiensis]|uniref:hypothetical protein n=1 Tax=Saccharomonospora iraqiensis TaxID=52698 RepID=UPI00022E24C4|nr:hypothetical protein [Saccharomonospora iraqiensis]